MIFKSIRWKLPLTYAGIALITMLVLGGTLLVILRGYYQDQEQAYLKGNALAIAKAIAPLIGGGNYPPDLKTHLILFAFLSQTNLRLIDPTGNEIGNFSYIGAQNTQAMIAAVTYNGQTVETSEPDVTKALQALKSGNRSVYPVPSGSQPDSLSLQLNPPTTIKVNPESTVKSVPQGMTIIYSPLDDSSQQKQTAGASSGAQESSAVSNTGQVEVSPSSIPKSQALISVFPVVGTMYGFNLVGTTSPTARSDQIYKAPILDPANKQLLATLELSDGPAYGTDIVNGVGRGVLLAGLIAVIIAAIAGWWISRLMSGPALTLTLAARKMAEGDLSVRAVNHSRDEFGEMANTFNEMADRVEETVHTLRAFVSDAAHELHTPLTALHTNLDLAERDTGLSQSQKQFLEDMRGQVNRLEAVTSDLLDLSRIESGTSKEACEELDLVAVARQVVEPYASQAEQAGLDFRLELPEYEAKVVGIASHLNRMLANLLDNAVKFTPQGGKVTLGLDIQGYQAMIWVADTGIGIPEEDQSSLFNRFHRARNATAYPGSGLGLAIVKAVVEEQDGKIKVESSPEGTKITVELPMMNK